MTRRLHPGGWAIAAAIAFTLALILQTSGALRRWNDLLVEHYSRWSSREVHSDLVIIGIDARSLDALNSWPWPRRNHARLLDVLHDASPARVFVDIDFSSSSTAEEDAALATALSRWPRERILLPLFVQETTGSGNETTLTRPLPEFARHATLGSVNLDPDGDSIVRRIQGSWAAQGSPLPSVFTLLSGAPASHAAMPIDFSISPASFAYYSYVDVMRGQVPLEALRGKTILIGAIAVELGDILPVPVHRSLPGVVVHALATQTALSGAVRTTPAWASLAVLAAWTLLLAWLMGRTRWSLNLALAGGAVLGAVGIGLAAWLARRWFDVAPLVVAAAGDFIVVTLGSLDAANLRSKLLARLANRRQVLFDSVFDSSYDGILCVDQDGAILSANAAALELLACPAEQIRTQRLTAFLPEMAGPAGIGGLEAMNGRILERTIRTGDEQRIPVEISTTVAAHEEGRHFTLILRDLRERRRQEEQLRHQATHDSLTGLPNRAHLLQELQQRIADPGNARFAVLVLNLTRFKEVNDTLGHTVGDVVLRATAHRLAAAMSDKGFISRMDGDGFAAIVEFDGDRDKLLPLARELLAVLRKPVVFEGVSISVGVSIGLACYPLDGLNATALLKNADIAMYEAKRLGEELAFYDPAHDQHSLRRLALLGELRTAMEADRLELHYQPQVSLATGRVEGVEALLRWNHPTHGVVSPGEIIPLIERTDMLRPLTDWTIRRALAQQIAWARQGVYVRMAVNLSARVLQDLKFPDRLAALLSAQPTPAGLELEITESATMLYVDRALEVGRRIRELGVQLSVDDYGTGHSSLSYLRDLSVSVLKLDRTFVENLENRLDNQVIVESTLALAHALRLTVVAEGVATAWQVDYLRRLGYDLGQGYFFSPALEGSSCLQWIRERNTPAHAGQAQVA